MRATRTLINIQALSVDHFKAGWTVIAFVRTDKVYARCEPADAVKLALVHVLAERIASAREAGRTRATYPRSGNICALAFEVTSSIVRQAFVHIRALAVRCGSLEPNLAGGLEFDLIR